MTVCWDFKNIMAHLSNFFKPFTKLQKYVMGVSSTETLKCPIRTKLLYVWIYSSIKEFKGSR